MRMLAPELLIDRRIGAEVALASAEQFNNLEHVPFAYFQTRNNLIGYTRGIVASPRQQPSIAATLVYVPGADGTHQKLLFNGYQGERLKGFPNLDAVSPDIRPMLTNYYYSSLTYQRPNGLTIPLHDIARFFDPWQTLQEWLQLDGAIPDALRYTVDWCEKTLQIPSASIGVYGSLQCGLKQENSSFNDIDLLVSGLAHANSILRHELDCARIDLTDHTPNGRLTVSRNRKKLASFVVNCGKEKKEIEFKVHRTVSDYNTYASMRDLHFVPNPAITRGVVIDDSESLSLPFAYRIRVQDSSRIVAVTGNWYDFIGAAKIGQEVIVNGFADTSGEYVLIANPMKHFIFPLAAA